MKCTKLLTLLLAVCPLAGIAQKIKYEDVFKLINSGAYTEAEPQLKAFMADPKNAEHANSYVQMGVIKEKRFYATDILADTSLFASRADSMVVLFKRAIQLIDEKELKKSSDLYQTFYRRDLRTGEFGIKLSDVHLDLEKKIENTGKRLKAIRNFRSLLLRINGRNNLSASLYKQIVEKSPIYRQLLFTFSEADVVALDRIKDNAQGLYPLINELKVASKELGSDYYQNLQDFKLIETYGKDGIEQDNPFDGRLDLWDYETWAKATQADYLAVKQYLTNIQKKEEELAKAQTQLTQGIEPIPITLESLLSNATLYDDDGTILNLLTLRIGRLDINRMASPVLNPDFSDSTNVYNRLKVAQQISEKLTELNIPFSEIVQPDLMELTVMRYSPIIDQYYGGASGYSQFLTEFGEWLSKQSLRWQIARASLTEREQYAITALDSIPLFVSPVDGMMKYQTLLVAGEDTKLAAGISVPTKEGYVVWSSASRDISAKKSFKVGTLNPQSKCGVLPTKQFAFYVFNPDIATENLAIVATGATGELKWTNLITAPNEPLSFRYDETLDQVTVFYFPQDQLPPDGVNAYIVIDRKGAVR